MKKTKAKDRSLRQLLQGGVFLRPYIIRDSEAGRSITLNRYDFMRRAQGGPRATIKAVPIEAGPRL